MSQSIVRMPANAAQHSRAFIANPGWRTLSRHPASDQAAQTLTASVRDGCRHRHHRQLVVHGVGDLAGNIIITLGTVQVISSNAPPAGLPMAGVISGAIFAAPHRWSATRRRRHAGGITDRTGGLRQAVQDTMLQSASDMVDFAKADELVAAAKDELAV